MTILCAINTERSTWIASDTVAVTYDTPIECGPKWVNVLEDWWVGVAGNLRTLNLLLDTSFPYDESRNPFGLANHIRKVLQKDDYDHDDSCIGPKRYGQQMIIANKEGVWAVSGDFSILKIPQGQMWAAGSGQEYAFGAEYGTHKLPAEVRLDAAIEAAKSLDMMCGGDTFIKEIL